LHGNGREWECKKPFPHISNLTPEVGSSMNEAPKGISLRGNTSYDV